MVQPGTYLSLSILYQTGTPRPMRLRTTDRIAEKICHIISSILKPYAVLRSTPRPGDFRMHSAKSVPARVNSSAKVFAVRFVRCLCLARYRSGNCCCQMEALHIAKHEYPVQHFTCKARIKRKSVVCIKEKGNVSSMAFEKGPLTHRL